MNIFSCAANTSIALAIDDSASGNRIAIPANTDVKPRNVAEITNIGTKTIYVAFGDSSVDAVAPASGGATGGIPVYSGATKHIGFSGTHVSAVCASGDTSTMVISFGRML